MKPVDKVCKYEEYETPEKVLECVMEYYGGEIPLDPATGSHNPTNAKRFYTIDDDGLEKPWDDMVFINPPYGKKLPKFIHKIYDECLYDTEIIALLPSNRFETKYFQDYALNDFLTCMCFVRGRLKFKLGDIVGGGNPFGSILYGWNISDSMKFKDVFSVLGRVFMVSL